MKDEELRRQKIILFDGVCNLCNRSVIFILSHEKEPVLRFASIQSEAGKELLAKCGLPGEFMEAVVFIDQGIVYLGSTAALKAGGYLRFPWSFLSRAGLLVPKPIRDRVYRHIARHRYRWFGKRDLCMVPAKNMESRFL